MITSVIFDIGNVLAAYDWEDALKRLGYSEETREIIGNAVFRSADWNEMDRGVLTLEELLQRFVRGDDARTGEGSGLGLSIAQSLTNLQGGKFRLQVDGDLFKACVIFPEHH